MQCVRLSLILLVFISLPLSAAERNRISEIFDVCGVVLRVAIQFSINKPKAPQKPVTFEQIQALSKTHVEKFFVESLKELHVGLVSPFQFSKDLSPLKNLISKGISGFLVEAFYKENDPNELAHFLRYAIQHLDGSMSFIYVQRSHELPWDQVKAKYRSPKPFTSLDYWVSTSTNTAMHLHYFADQFQFEDSVLGEEARKNDEAIVQSLQGAGFKAKLL